MNINYGKWKANDNWKSIIYMIFNQISKNHAYNIINWIIVYLAITSVLHYQRDDILPIHNCLIGSRTINITRPRGEGRCAMLNTRLYEMKKWTNNTFRFTYVLRATTCSTMKQIYKNGHNFVPTNPNQALEIALES